MSYRVKMILPVVGMFLLACVVVAAVSNEGGEIKQPLPSSLENLGAAKLIEVKDAAGQLILGGSFVMTTKKNGDVEGEATLAATGAHAEAAGKAEVEVSTRDGRVEKELEVEVRNLAPGASFGVFVDGQQAATFTTNPRGAAKLELSDEPSS